MARYQRNRVRKNKTSKSRKSNAWKAVRNDLGITRTTVNIFSAINGNFATTEGVANVPLQYGYAFRPLSDLMTDSRWPSFKQSHDEFRIKRVRITINQRYFPARVFPSGGKTFEVGLAANLEDGKTDPPKEVGSVQVPGYEDYSLQTFMAWDRNSYYTSSAAINRVAPTGA